MPSSSCLGSDFSPRLPCCEAALLSRFGLLRPTLAIPLPGCPPHPAWALTPHTGLPSQMFRLSCSHCILISSLCIYLSSPQRSATPPSLDCVQFFLTYCYLFQCQVHRRHSICAYWVHEGRTTWVKALRREGGNGVGADGAETRNRQKGREAKFRSALWDDRGNRLEGDRSVSCFGCTPLAVPQRVH